MCLCGLRFKKHIIFHILYIIVAPLCPAFWNALIFTKLIVLRSEACSDWPATQCVVFGRIPQAWDGNVTPLTVLWCRVPARRHKNNKTHHKLGFCSRRVNIIMSAFVNGETTNNKHYSTQLKTHVWIVSSRNVLTGCESEASDSSCKVGIAPLYRNSLCASCRLLSQVQEIVLHKMRCTLSNIWVELFWNSVVNNLTTDF